MREQRLRIIHGAVEGLLDEVVLRRVIKHSHAEPGRIFGGNGKTHLLERLPGYNEAARLDPWVVLLDLDNDASCAPSLRTRVLAHPAEKMCFRIAVREIEAWLMGDVERLAAFLRVPSSRVSKQPEALSDPKRAMIDLAKRSRSRDIREDMVPRPESGRRVGPVYVGRLIEFVQDAAAGWRPEVAAGSSDSLRRCLRHLRRLAEQP